MGKNYVYIFLHLNKSGGTTINAQMYKNLNVGEYIHIGQPWIKRKQRGKNFEKRSSSERRKVKFITGHKAYYGLHTYVKNKIPRYFTVLRCPAERLISYYNHEMSGLSKKYRIPFIKWYNNRKKNEILEFYCERIKNQNKKNTLNNYLIERLSELSRLIPGHEKRLNFGRRILKRKKQKENTKEILKEKLGKVQGLFDKMWFVGVVKRLNKDLPILFEKLGVPTTWKNYAIAGKKESENKLNENNSRTNEKIFILNAETKNLIYKENPFDVKLYNYAQKLNKLKVKQIKNE